MKTTRFRAHLLLSLLLALIAATLPESASAQTSAVPGRGLANPNLAIRFASEDAGLGVEAIEHRAGPGLPEAFTSAAPADALIWRILLRGPADMAGKSADLWLDNRVPCRRSAKIAVAAGTVALRWEGIDAGNEKGVIDVDVDVSLPPAGPASLWRMAVTNRSARLGVWETHFPDFAGCGAGGKLDLAIPRGNRGVLLRGVVTPQEATYPGMHWPMQFLLAQRGDRGLLLAARDPEAWPKRYVMKAGGEFAFVWYAENMGVPGAGFRMPGPVAVEAYRETWWAGAKRYREWSLTAPWAHRGPIAARKDFPAALRRTALWWQSGGTAAEVVPKMKEAVKRFDVPQAIHWYNWHQIPFDTNYPEYFPPKDGFADGVKELVGAGQLVMPYINARLWDTGGPNFPSAMPFTCKKPGGTDPYIEVYGSGAKLAPMCPATKFWQDKVGEIVRRLGDEQGVNAVYLDQIAAADAALCFDPAHGHPLGGGGHWVDGYRRMLAPIHALAAGRGMTLTTECNAEPYMDGVDAFLTWCPASDDEIPLMTAVYGGRTVCFGSPARGGMDPDSFAMLQERDLLWGAQPGWMGFDLLGPDRKGQAELLLACARCRKALEPYLLEGELLGELAPEDPPPPIQGTWAGWQGTHPAKLPSVMTAVWRAPDGRVALLFANLSAEARTLAYRFDAATWGMVPGGRLKLTRVTSENRDPVGEVDAAFRRVETLAPRSIAVLEVNSGR